VAVAKNIPPGERSPVGSEEFWRERLFRALAAEGTVRQAIFDDSHELWQWVTEEYSRLIQEFIQPGSRVLDAGCGYGALLDSFRIARMNSVDYTGIDLSPELIKVATYRYPGRRFFVGRLEDLPFPDGWFDWVIFRSMDGMIKKNLGDAAWMTVAREAARVGKKLLIGGYSDYPGERVPYMVKSGEEASKAGDDPAAWARVGEGRG